MLSLINNLSSLIAQNNLSSSNSSLNTSLQRLSSGLRINSGADDPAGLVISQEQMAQMSGLQTAITNTSKDVNVVQLADGGLNEINSLLLQIRGLAVDAANSGANDTKTLAADQAQISNALDTITRIATSTQFGHDQLLDGSHAASVQSLTGGDANDSASIAGNVQQGSYAVVVSKAATATTLTGTAFGNSSNSNKLDNAETLTINGVNVVLSAGSTGSQANTAINAVTANTGVAAAYDSTNNILTLYSTQFGSGHNINVTTTVSGGGSDQTGLNGVAATQGTDVTGTINGVAADGVGNVLTSNAGATAGLSVTFAANSTVPYQMADANNTTLTANVDTSNGLVFQIGANGGQTATLTIQSVQANALGVGGGSGINNLSLIDVTSSTQSSTSILNVIDKAISDVSNLAGTLGAFQDNTLQATAANLQTSLQNTTAANSTIRDTNFAQESATYAQNQVLVQAGTQVLKNSNQLPQLILTLLQ